MSPQTIKLTLIAACVSILAGCADWIPAEPPPAPSPTPTIAATSVSALPVLLQDDFSDPGSGWEIGEYDWGSVSYGGGVYVVRATQIGDAMWGAANLHFSDVVVEVDATLVEGPSNSNVAYGVICRAQPNGDGYWFRVSGDTYFSIFKVVDGKFERLQRWKGSNAIRRGAATNRLGVTCKGSVLSLAINGAVVWTMEDETFAEGDVALNAVSYEEGAVEVHFDNLRMFEP